MEISVVVPVFNGGNKIQGCISALKRQKTRRSFEIIVVDDGSTDRSLHGFEGNGIRVLKQAKQGPAAARNLGVEKSRGEIILFTDSDCEPQEDWLEQLVRPLMDSSISGVKGSYLSRQKRIVPRFVQLEYESKYDKVRRYRFIDFIDTYSAGFIKKDFLSVGKFDTNFLVAEDQELSFRMWKKGYRMVFKPEAMVYHTHSENFSNYVKKKFRIGFWKALVLKKHPKKIIRDSHTPQLLKFEMGFAMLFLVLLLLSPLNGQFFFYSLFPLACFLLTIFSSVLKMLRKDPTVAIFSPFLLFARAVSLSCGLIVGFFKFLVSK